MSKINRYICKFTKISLLSLFAASSISWASTEEIYRFSSIHGDVVQQEDAHGRSSLKFVSKGNLVALPMDWTNVAIENVIDLSGQTAILMSHAQGKCESKMSLAVVAPNGFLGPYDIGDCEDVLVHQRSADGKSLIAVRSEKVGGRAWVYSSDDESFRGPVKIKLPKSMAFMVAPEDLKKSLVVATAVKKQKTLRIQETLNSGESLVAPRSSEAETLLLTPQRPTAKASTSAPEKRDVGTTLSSRDASKVVDQAKRSTPRQPKIVINL